MGADVIETNRIRLRPWERRDLDEVLAMDLAPEVYQYSQVYRIHEAPNPQRAKLRQEIRRQISTGSAGDFWIIEWKTNPGLLGLIGLTPGVLTAQLSYRLAVQYWGHGIATEAALAFCSYFIRRRAFQTITALCHRDNTRSQRVLKKIGMHAQGIATVKQKSILLRDDLRVSQNIFNIQPNMEHYYISYLLDFATCLERCASAID